MGPAGAWGTRPGKGVGVGGTPRNWGTVKGAVGGEGGKISFEVQTPFSFGCKC